jgi:imidazolonepropionase-like amidohydrolase
VNPYTEGALGVIKEGAYADLLIYEGNPLEDIQVIVKSQRKFEVDHEGRKNI